MLVNGDESSLETKDRKQDELRPDLAFKRGVSMVKYL